MTAINQITTEDAAAFEAQIKDVGNFGVNLADEYQRISSKSAIYPGQGTPLGLAYCALKLNGEAGEFAEHVGKAMRDDGLMNGLYIDGGAVQYADGTLTLDRKIALLKELGDQLWYIGAACRELGTTISEVMLMNLEKLADRTRRNALKGSGDDR